MKRPIYKEFIDYNTHQITNPDEVEQAASFINLNIKEAIRISTKKIQIKSASNNFTQIPQFIHGQIKQKRQLIRLLKKTTHFKPKKS